MRLFTLIATAISLALATTSVAQPPDRLDQYRLLPRYSVLGQSGGSPGTATRYPLRGEYDFSQQWTGGTATDPLKLVPSFDNVDIRAPLGPMLPAFIDVGFLFNMELLRGEQLPLPTAFAAFDVFRFEGTANDSSAASPLEQSLVEMYAVTYGPWMYLRGETIPRSWSGEIPEYDLRALARSGDWSDYSEDGVVDASDYTLIRDTASKLAAPTDQWLVEASTRWRSDYGDRAPDLDFFEQAIAIAMSQQGTVAIPEPAGAFLMMLASLALGVTTRVPRRALPDRKT